MTKISYTIDQDILKSISRVRYFSPNRRRSFIQGIFLISPLIGLCSFQLFNGDAILTFASIFISMLILLGLHLLPKYFWDPFYTFKARSWLGAKVSYEILGENIIHKWNDTTIEIPISKCTQITSPSIGLILNFGNSEIVFHEELDRTIINEFTTRIRNIQSQKPII